MTQSNGYCHVIRSVIETEFHVSAYHYIRLIFIFILFVNTDNIQKSIKLKLKF